MKVEKRWMSKITGKLWDTPGTKDEFPVAIIPWDEWEAEIKTAYDSGRQDEHYAMEETVMTLVGNAKDRRGEEVLELAEHFIGAMGGSQAWRKFRQIYRERFDELPEVMQ